MGWIAYDSARSDAIRARARLVIALTHCLNEVMSGLAAALGENQ